MKDVLLNFINNQFELAIDASPKYLFIEVKEADWIAFMNERGLKDLDLCEEINVYFKDVEEEKRSLLSAYTRQDGDFKFYGIALLKAAFVD